MISTWLFHVFFKVNVNLKILRGAFETTKRFLVLDASCDNDEGLNQKWTIKRADLNSYNLGVEQTNMNLDTRWGTTRSGSRLMQWPKSTDLTPKWLFIPLGNGYYKIINKASGRALSVNGGAAANTNNTYLVQLNYAGLALQQWRLEATQ